MMKNYASDPAKRRSRSKLRGFIEDTLLQRLEPEEVSVLHLPGPNSLEYQHVYEPLGIRDVVGVEKNADAAATAHEATPAVDVRHQTLFDFIRDEPESKYNVISLDFTGYLSEGRNALANALSMYRADEFVLHVNFQKGREHQADQAVVRGQNTNMQNWREEETLEHITNEFSEERHTYLENMLHHAHTLPRATPLNRLFELTYGDTASRRCAQLLNSEKQGFNPPYDEELDPDSLESEPEDILQFLTHINHFEDVIHDIHDTIVARTEEERAARNRLATALHLLPAKTQMTERSAGYEYVSNTGTPMKGGMAYLRPERSVERIRKNIWKHIKFSRGNILIQRPVELLQAIPSDFYEANYYDDLPVEDLGSSPQTTDAPALSKDDARILVRGGVPTSEIMDTFPGTNKDMVKALRAVHTRKTSD